MEPLAVAAVLVLLLVIYIVAGVAKKKAPSSDPGTVASMTPARTDAQAPSCASVVTADEPVLKTPRKRKAPRVVEITVETPLGPVTLKIPRRPAAAVVVALGQSEDHLNWFYNVYRRQYLQRAVANLKAYEKGTKDRSSWSDSYFEFIQESPTLLNNLDDEREQALNENRSKIERGEVTVLGTYPTIARAHEAAHYLPKKKEPTLNAGWLQVHVVEMPYSDG